MSLKKIIAGLAVVGMVGVVSAAAPEPNGANVKTVTADQELTASYEVVLLAKITVQQVGSGLKDNALLVNPSSLVSATPNLGTVKVETNYNAWDVVVTSANGATLKKGFGNSAKKLMYTGHPDSTRTGTDSIAYLNVVIYALGNNNSPISASVTDITDTLIAGGPVSFAYEIGNIGTGSFAPTNQPYSTGTNHIKDNGFAVPVDTYADSGITFGVCAGFNLAAEDKIKGQNEEGVYSETLTFTLAASF